MNEPQLSVELPTGGRYTGPRSKALGMLKYSRALAAAARKTRMSEELAVASYWMPR